MYKKIIKLLYYCILILVLVSISSFILLLFEKNTKHAHKATTVHTNQIKEKVPYKYNYHKVDKESDLKSYVSYNEKELDSSITFVTAYFDIGSFKKGDTSYHTTDMYKRWMSIFKRIDNKLVVYVEDSTYHKYFTLLRKHLINKTKIIMVNRTELQSFKHINTISRIFKQKGYPQYNPNTIVPEYTCIMHAKYELLRNTIILNPFKSRYVAWIDVGVFRDLVSLKGPLFKNEPLFSLHIPPNFNESSVAYSRVNMRRPYLSPLDIVFGNSVWVCGCYFISTIHVMFRWAAEYSEGVEWLMRRNLMNTDQQIIYILHNHRLTKTPLQEYIPEGAYNSWFYLPYISAIF